MPSRLQVKLFGTAVRGRLDTSGWVSIIATGGKVLFERQGDLELQVIAADCMRFALVLACARLPLVWHTRVHTRWLTGGLAAQDGNYRTAGTCDLQSAAGGDKSGSLPAGLHALTSVAAGSDGTIWGELKGQGWLAIMSAEHGVVADRIVEGFNDKQSDEEFEDPPAPNQMMLVRARYRTPRTSARPSSPPLLVCALPPFPSQQRLSARLPPRQLSDMVLAWDADFRKVLEEYAEDEELMTKDFAAAFKKLTELGCGFA